MTEKYKTLDGYVDDEYHDTKINMFQKIAETIPEGKYKVKVTVEKLNEQ